MKIFKLTMIALALVPAGQAFSNPMTAELLPNFEQARRIINSLHMDKPGQIRVRAIDGSEFTSAEALWLKSQLRSVELAATRGDSKLAMVEMQHIESRLSSLK